MTQTRNHAARELATADWFKSSYSDGTGNACIEVADLTSTVGIRDSKVPARAALTVSPATWSAFINTVR